MPVFSQNPKALSALCPQLVSLSLDLVALEELDLQLPGLQLVRAKLQQSALAQLVRPCSAVGADIYICNRNSVNLA